jgi:hypothetical protein
MKRGTPDHPKTITLAASLRVDRYVAVGLLELLWHFTAKYTPQGDIGKYSNCAIADALHWKKDPERLISALIASHWLDEDSRYRLLVHDWQDHADDATKKHLIRQNRGFLSAGAPLRHPVPSIYFIRASNSKRVKIGFTEGDPQSRLSILQTGSPEPLVLIGSVPGTRQDECRLHERLRALNIGGEWFEENKELMDYIGSRCQPSADFGSPPLPLPLPVPKANTSSKTAEDTFDLSPPPDSSTVKEECPSETIRRRWFREEFWIKGVVWAKIGGPPATEVSWLSKVRTRIEADQIIAAARAQGPDIMVAAIERAQRDGGKVRPLHPKTWLNQGRWQDEPVVVPVGAEQQKPSPYHKWVPPPEAE